MNEEAFVAALTLTAAGIGGIIALLHRPMRRMLADVCRKPHYTTFWTLFAEIHLTLLPLTVAVIGGASETAVHEPFLLQVVHYAKWSLMGLVLAMLTLAMLMAVLSRTMMAATVWVAPHQVGDLERLLDKMERIR